MLLINLLGALLIVLIIWWFWLYKPKEVEVSGDEILVTIKDGTYQPSRIKIEAGQSKKIQFLRKDATPCASMVQFPDMEISEEIPMDNVKVIEIPALNKGEYAFHCQMQMYRGTLIVD